MVDVVGMRRTFRLERHSWKKHERDPHIREMLSESFGCLLSTLALCAREGANQVGHGYARGIGVGRPRSCIEILHRNMAGIQALFP